MLALRAIAAVFRAIFKTRADLMVENRALRQQLNVLRRKAGRPRLRNQDRVFWLWLARSWGSWRDSLIVVKPETVVRWHRHGFKYHWTWKSRRRRGRPTVPREDLVSIDFFTVPTIRFRILFVFVVLAHARRRILHFNVTAHPTAAGPGRQIVEAFPWETAPSYLIRDRDGIYGNDFTRCVHSLGIKQVVTARRSPWQNGYVERVIGSIRRECTDHIIVFNENHLRRLLQSYLRYYHKSRTHLSLEKAAP